jgi:SpoVK/Ycf46/Vps4 family AAA+-type ATPase
MGSEAEPRADWSQLGLPDDFIQQLRDLCLIARQRGSLLAHFGGSSGTGKTMAAEVIAGELGRPLIQIDLAGVVSKWIGETEKNLDRVFESATDSNAVLFFDEADALFAKRTEVKDSHDRYANLEIAYLIRKVESYRGVAIIATATRDEIDEALLHRFAISVIFPAP